MSAASQDTRLVRSSGKTIHLRGCSRAGRVVPWAWAEGLNDLVWVGKAWLKPCRSCLPDLASLQDQLRRQAAHVQAGAEAPVSLTKGAEQSAAKTP